MKTEDRQTSMLQARKLLKGHTCPHCSKKCLGGNIRNHELNCHLNPANRKECPICKTYIKNYRTNKTCSIKCSNLLFKSGSKPNQRDQLGSTSASYKLTKDLLFKFVIDTGHKCFRCNGELTRDDFTIDHKIPWLNDSKSKELFFDLENIAYSHKKCNYKAARRPFKSAGVV